jgi:large subunit ribosomal protein L29
MTVKLDEIKGLTPDQLDDQLMSLKKEQFNLRFRRATGQVEDTSRMRKVRRQIAQVMTVQTQKKQVGKKA